MQISQAPARGIRRTVYPTEREVLLARLLLRVVDHFWSEEEFYADEETHDLYNRVKPIAEATLRVSRETNNTNKELTNGD